MPETETCPSECAETNHPGMEHEQWLPPEQEAAVMRLLEFVRPAMTPQHPAAPETETDANGLTETERKSLWRVIATVRDGAPRLPDDADTEDIIDAILDSGWVHRLVAERVRVVEGERDAARASRERWMEKCANTEDALALLLNRAESAEAAHEADKAAHERLRAEFSELADDFASNVDWSAGRGNYGDNEAWERAAREVRSLLGGGGAR